MENEKIYKVIKFVIIFLSVITMIPNILPLIKVLPGIYNQEIDYMEGIYLTVYCILGVVIPLFFIVKSNKIIEALAYKLTNKDDFTEVIKNVGLFLIVISAVLILKVSYHSSYTYSIKFNRIISTGIGLIIYLKSGKINLILLTYVEAYKKAKE